MIAFIIVSISILSGFMINNFQDRKKSNLGENESPVSTEGVMGNPSGADKDSGFIFFVNEGAVKKTKTTLNEVTTFVIEAKLFITNTSEKTELIDPDAFLISYDTAGTGLLYSVDYGNIEKPVVLEGNGTTAINFIITYLIHDAQNFNDNTKKELKFSYINKQNYICLV